MLFGKFGLILRKNITYSHTFIVERLCFEYIAFPRLFSFFFCSVWFIPLIINILFTVDRFNTDRKRHTASSNLRRTLKENKLPDYTRKIIVNFPDKKLHTDHEIGKVNCLISITKWRTFNYCYRNDIEVVAQREVFYKILFEKYAANLQKNTRGEVWFQKNLISKFIETTLRNGCPPVNLRQIFKHFL